MSIEGHRWYAIEGGNLQKFAITVLMNPRKVDELIFQENGLWVQVERHALESPAVIRHTNSMIGSKFGMMRRYDLKEVFRLILPTPEMVGDNSILLNLEEAPEFVVDNFLAELLNPQINATVVWPIIGVSTEAPLELDENFTFRELTITEKISCLNFGMIASSYDTSFSPETSKWYGLALQTIYPKFTPAMEADDPNEINEHFQFQQNALEDFLICACLIADTIVGHGGGHAHAPSIELGGIFAGGVSGHGVQNGNIWFQFSDSSHKISGSERNRFIEIWKQLRGKSTQKGYLQIINAARRLYYSSTRHKASDILVDLMIAAESLYLNGEDKAELSYRLSLNASLWDSSTTDRQSDVFNLFRSAYSRRSDIVHGKFIQDAVVAEVCTEVKPLIKNGIIKAFDFMMRGEKLPKWETLLFPRNLPREANDASQ
jgi:hypothetical protein